MMKSGVIWQYVILALGVTICLAGAFLMWDGSILGENHAGIATVIGIIGIGIIDTFAVIHSALAAIHPEGDEKYD
jgi:hypothetical protein